VQGKVVVRWSVKVHVPVASAGVTAPPPPLMIPSRGSVLVSQAIKRSIADTKSKLRFT
jgi:hypothetical protein